MTQEARREALREAEERRAIQAQEYIRQLGDPADAIRRGLESSGASIIDIKRVNRGYEVNWTSRGHRINSLFDRELRVIEGGFCMSGHDSTQSVVSIGKVLNDYVDEGSYIHRTRTTL
jgi:hypothetical protein